MLRKGPGLLDSAENCPAPDRVSETQVRLTDHELQIGGILASVRQSPPTQYRLWIRHIPSLAHAQQEGADAWTRKGLSPIGTTHTPLASALVPRHQ